MLLLLYQRRKLSIEAIRTANKDQDITIVTDGNPSYIEATQFLNKDRPKEHKIKHVQVIGLQDEDEVSEEYRPFKQMQDDLNFWANGRSRLAGSFN